MQSAYGPLLDRLGLTYPQYLVLSSLGDQDDQTVGQLGTVLHLDSNTLTPLLKRIEAAGLVSRHRDPADERQVRVALTESGRNVIAQAADIPDQFAQSTGLSDAEIAQLRAALTTLRNHLRPRPKRRGP